MQEKCKELHPDSDSRLWSMKLSFYPPAFLGEDTAGTLDLTHLLEVVMEEEMSAPASEIDTPDPEKVSVDDIVNDLDSDRLYEKIGVPKDATLPTIRRSWRLAILRNHPDHAEKNGIDPEKAILATRLLVLVRDVLFDAERREQYDSGVPAAFILHTSQRTSQPSSADPEEDDLADSTAEAARETYERTRTARDKEIAVQAAMPAALVRGNRSAQADEDLLVPDCESLLAACELLDAEHPRGLMTSQANEEESRSQTAGLNDDEDDIYGVSDQDAAPKAASSRLLDTPAPVPSASSRAPSAASTSAFPSSLSGRSGGDGPRNPQVRLHLISMETSCSLIHLFPWKQPAPLNLIPWKQRAPLTSL